MENAAPLIDVVLYLRGDALDPGLVTAMLGTNGSKMLAKGDTWTTSADKEVTARVGLWTLDAEAGSNSLSDQIGWLRNKLGAAKCSLLDIPGVDQAEVSAFIALGSNSQGNGDYSTELSADDLAWLSCTGAALSFQMFHEANAPAMQDHPMAQ